MAKSELPARRELKFSSLDEMVRDAERLQQYGYDQLGNWDFSQICNHLANWLSYPCEGFPPASPAIAAILWVIRNTIGRRKLRKILNSGRFPSGQPTMPQTVFKPGGNEAVALDKLKKTAKWLRDHTGDVYPSPLFGRMTKDECVQLQLLHCAHHLSYLVPKTK